MDNFSKYTFATILPTVFDHFRGNNALGFVDDDAMTYGQLEENISALQFFLEKHQVVPGEKVILYSQNMPHWGLAFFTMQCMGVVTVPVLPEFTAVEMQNVIDHSGAKAMFISDSLRYKLSDLSSDKIDLILQLDDFSIIKGKSEINFNATDRSAKTYDPDENQLSILLYTSGTTGNSKGVMLSQKNVIINALQGNEVQKILETDKFLSVLPLAHTYENTLGLILPILFGASISYLKKPPTASVLMPALEKVKPDVMLTVPMIIEKVFQNKVLPGINQKWITRLLYRVRFGQKLLHKVAGKKVYQTFGGRLKFFGVGGAKLDARVERWLRDAKFPYAIGYGLTETSPLLAGSNANTTRFQAIGKVVNNCELKIHNPDPKTGEGEIWAKGPNVMLGYYKNDDLTREVITEDGWFKTGDLGVFDKEGWLSHKGRLKNMIVGANGENIYPEEIESVINNFKHVVESLVVEQKGKLVALVHFNKEELENKLKEMKHDLVQKVDDLLEELASELHEYVNARVNKFSRIQALVVHHDPFKKTATQKIKRYLYK